VEGQQEISAGSVESTKRARSDSSDNEEPDAKRQKQQEQSPLDYVLEKQSCEMPNIFEADGGGD
jgi:hypothetical protein